MLLICAFLFKVSEKLCSVALRFSSRFVRHCNTATHYEQPDRSNLLLRMKSSTICTSGTSSRFVGAISKFIRLFAFITGGGGRRGKQFSTPLGDHAYVSNAETSMPYE